MTNKELISKIKAEIERRKKSLRAGICNEEVFTRKQRKEMLVASEELDRLNRFLSDLEKSEKPMNQDGLEEELEKEINEAMKSDLCPEEISNYDFCCIARHFAKWGAENLKK